MLCKSSSSVKDLCVYDKNKLLSLHCVIMLHRYVFIHQRDENDLSEVVEVPALVIGMPSVQRTGCIRTNCTIFIPGSQSLPLNTETLFHLL